MNKLVVSFTSLEGLAEIALASGDASRCRAYADELLAIAEANGLRELKAVGRRGAGGRYRPGATADGHAGHAGSPACCAGSARCSAAPHRQGASDRGCDREKSAVVRTSGAAPC